MILTSTSFIISLFYISAGITLIVALISGLAGSSYRGKDRKLYFYFSAMCLFITGYILSSAYYYLSETLEQAILALKWQIAFTIAMLPQLFIFIALHTDQNRTQPWSSILSVMSIAFMIANIDAPYSLRFSEISTQFEIIFPWGEIIHSYNGPIGKIRLVRLTGLAITLWGIYRGIRIWRSGNARKGIAIIASLLLLIASIVWGALIDHGIIHSVYFIGFGFLSLVVLMSLSLASQIRNQSKLLEDSLNKISISAIAFETQDAIIITDQNATIIQVNHAVEEITGQNQQALIGKKLWHLSERFDEKEYTEIERQLNKTGHWIGELWLSTQNKNNYPNHAKITAIRDTNGQIVNFVAVYRNLTEVKKAEDYIDFIRTYDTLTGLPNRNTFIEYQQDFSARNKKDESYNAIFIVNLDQFRIINDTIGHEVGDLVLYEISHRLKNQIPDENCCARIEGDEFIAVVRGIHTDKLKASKIALDKAQSIQEALCQPFTMSKHEFFISASIGITLFKNAQFEADALIQHAHIAMIEAKSQAGNSIQMFEHDLQNKLIYESEIEKELRKALDNQELQLYYQIQTDKNGRATGAEALLRWIHPKRGMVPPSEFIAIAEESPLINRIGHWVLCEACNTLKSWQSMPEFHDLTLSVNVSSKQFLDKQFVPTVAGLISDTKISAHQLKLEITESVIFSDKEIAISKTLELRNKIGVKLAIDDFGTGYSSLSYLKDLAVDEIKIDQSFIRGICTHHTDAAIVKTIISLAKNLSLNVIAEGVEVAEQLQLLQQYDCDHYQGYLFSKPLPLDQFELLIKHQTSA